MRSPENDLWSPPQEVIHETYTNNNKIRTYETEELNISKSRDIGKKVLQSLHPTENFISSNKNEFRVFLKIKLIILKCVVLI